MISPPNQIITFCSSRILALYSTLINIEQQSNIFTLNINPSIAGSDNSKTVIFIYKFVQRMRVLKKLSRRTPCSNQLLPASSTAAPSHLLGINSFPHSSVALWHFPLQCTIALGLSHMSKYS